MCAGWRLTPYPAYDPGTLSLIYSPFLLKLPVLAASTSLRRSRPGGTGGDWPPPVRSLHHE
ncbi:hypothetical protein BUE65_22955 [Klebsiella variicola]|nr:hypothetical protein BUE65_22955 [Klebsiella variicola]